jgi:hypothetical protein
MIGPARTNLRDQSDRALKAAMLGERDQNLWSHCQAGPMGPDREEE